LRPRRGIIVGAWRLQPRRDRQETTMTTKTMLATGLAMAFAAAAALAAPGGGYGPGHGGGPGYGMGYGGGYGPCATGAAAGGATGECPRGPGYGPGGGYGRMGRGMGYGPGGAGTLMTDEERATHRERMHSFTTLQECNAYWTEHRAQMAARAQERGLEPGPGPRFNPCERMAARGILTP